MNIVHRVMVTFALLLFLITLIQSSETTNDEQCVITSNPPTYEQIVTTTSMEENGVDIEFEFPFYEQIVEDDSTTTNDDREGEILRYSVSFFSNLNITRFDVCKARSILELSTTSNIKEVKKGEEVFTLEYYHDSTFLEEYETDSIRSIEGSSKNEIIRSYPLKVSYESRQHYQLFPVNTRQDLAMYRVLDSSVDYTFSEGYVLYRWFLEVQYYGELNIGFSGFKSGHPVNETYHERSFDKYDNHVSLIEITSLYPVFSKKKKNNIQERQQVANEILLFEYNKEETSRIVQEVVLKPVRTGLVIITPGKEEELRMIQQEEEEEEEEGILVSQFISSVHYSSNETFPTSVLSAQTEFVLTTVLSHSHHDKNEKVEPVSVVFTCLTCPTERIYEYTNECTEEDEKECFTITSSSTNQGNKKLSSLSTTKIIFRLKPKRKLEIGTYSIESKFALSQQSSHQIVLPKEEEEETRKTPKTPKTRRTIFIYAFSQIIISKFEPAPSVFKIVITFAGAALGFLSAGGGLSIGLFVMRVIRKQSDKNRVYYQRVGGQHVIDETTGERIQLFDMCFNLRHREIKFKGTQEIRNLNRSFEEVFKLQKASKYTPYVHCKHCWEEQHGKSLPQIQHQQRMKVLKQQQQQQLQRNNNNNNDNLNNNPILRRKKKEKTNIMMLDEDDDDEEEELQTLITIVAAEEDEDQLFLKYDGSSKCCVKCGIPLLRFIAFEDEDLFCVLCAMMNKYQPRPHGRCLLHLSNSKKSNYNRRRRRRNKSNSKSITPPPLPIPNNNNNNNNNSIVVPKPPISGYHPLPLSSQTDTMDQDDHEEPKLLNSSDEEEFAKQGAVYVIFRGQFSVGSVSRQMKRRKKEQEEEEQQQIKSPSLNNLENNNNNNNNSTTIKRKRRRRRRKAKKMSPFDSKIPEWISKVTSSSIWKLNSLMRFEYLSLMSGLVHTDLSSFDPKKNGNHHHHHHNINKFYSSEKQRISQGIVLLKQTLKHVFEKISEVGPNMKSRYLKRLKIENLKLGNDGNLNIRNCDLETFFDNFRCTLSLLAAQTLKHITFLKKDLKALEVKRKQHIEQLKRYKKLQNLNLDTKNNSINDRNDRNDNKKKRRKRKRQFKFVDEIDEVDDEINDILSNSANTTPSPNTILDSFEKPSIGSLIEHHHPQQQFKISKKRKRNDGEILRLGRHHYYYSNPNKASSSLVGPPPPPPPPLPPLVMNNNNNNQQQQLEQELQELEQIMNVNNFNEITIDEPNNNIQQMIMMKQQNNPGQPLIWSSNSSSSSNNNNNNIIKNVDGKVSSNSSTGFEEFDNNNNSNNNTLILNGLFFNPKQLAFHQDNQIIIKEGDTIDTDDSNMVLFGDQQQHQLLLQGDNKQQQEEESFDLDGYLKNQFEMDDETLNYLNYNYNQVIDQNDDDIGFGIEDQLL